MSVKTAGLTALVTVPALLLATACTSGDGKSPAKNTDTDVGTSAAASPSTAASAGTGSETGKDGGSGAGDTSAPLTGSQLQRAALATKDLPGFQVSADKSALAPSGQPAADKPRCQPLADAMGDKPNPQAIRTVSRGLGSLDNLGLAVSASVSSYSEATAKKLMDGLTSAVSACGAGFAATLDGRSGLYSEVKTADFTTRGADETVSWTTVGTNEGAVAPLHLVVVRKGATVARFMALDLARRTPPRVPQEVADKQLAKVAQVRAG
ncbi:hypothetical protein OG883_03220 [Streptomyces sp. NBC_01142]|uniref:hypothetical protein n=1 Tax=Streptomyces sp. NBC_01142 TaxID=2975865 RepID=UPI002252F3AB|nr:hypothetical protein [Streptomyces sp. NBC_01142]MCX4818930.1 hypothetical protein [Streptomyces sp. NBC_01142]